MISISTISDFFLEEGYRIFKVIQYGAKTADECSPFGDDSNPPDDFDAVFAETEVIGEPIILGYIQQNRKSLPGEKRIYSLQEDGEEATDIYLKKNGVIEVGGNADNFVAYKNLNLKLQEQNAKMAAELVKIQAALAALGGVYTPGDISLDISSAKTKLIKCQKPETP